MTQAIELIVVDIDGTLLNEEHQLSERNEKALKSAMKKGVQVVLATGKTRHSATDLIARLGLTTPGIYLQGLAIYEPDGSISYQQVLEPAIARQVITFAEDRGFDVAAYSGSRILARSVTPKVEELATQYHEPMPEGIGPLQNILGEMPVHKLMVVKEGQPKRITALRWQLNMQLDGKGRLVQAMIPDMLEILPPNASKGNALKTLLRKMNIPADRVMAIGDGENDLEMIQLAGIGVAVGNADQKLKDAADHIVASNDDNGVAGAVEEWILGGDTSTETDTDVKNESTEPETEKSAEVQSE